MQIKITDDLDLDKIIHSGQCFRGARIDNWYRFITKDHVLYIRQQEGNIYEASCDEKEWKSIWRPFFDLRRTYSKVRTRCKSDPFLKAAAKHSKGIRILKQDPWEMLLTFIISQRKSIPSIKKCVETLSETYGNRMETPFEVVYTFPTWEQLEAVTEEAFRGVGLGYRAPYIYHVVQTMRGEHISLQALAELENEALHARLKEFKGVGDKVASCIMLYAYGRTAAVPIDTWIHKIIDGQYGGKNPFVAYGDDAGIVQQYAFDFVTHQETALETNRNKDSL